MVCRGRCGRRQMCFDAFVTGFPKTDSSLFDVFHINSCRVATLVGTNVLNHSAAHTTQRPAPTILIRVFER